MASLEVALNKIEPGQTITVKWRGKPVFIKRRTEEDIEYARDVDISTLRDPQTDEERVQNPEVRKCFQCLLRSIDSVSAARTSSMLPDALLQG